MCEWMCACACCAVMSLQQCSGQLAHQRNCEWTELLQRASDVKNAAQRVTLQDLKSVCWCVCVGLCVAIVAPHASKQPQRNNNPGKWDRSRRKAEQEVQIKHWGSFLFICKLQK